MATHNEPVAGARPGPWVSSLWTWSGVHFGLIGTKGKTSFSLKKDPNLLSRNLSCPVFAMSHITANGTMSDDMEAQQSAGLGPVVGMPHIEKQHVADWDGPHDPENPRNWKATTKMAHVCLVSAFTLYA